MVNSPWRICLEEVSPCEFIADSLENVTDNSLCSSNGGVFGSLFGTPIINLPQAAVLGSYLHVYFSVFAK